MEQFKATIQQACYEQTIKHHKMQQSKSSVKHSAVESGTDNTDDLSCRCLGNLSLNQAPSTARPSSPHCSCTQENGLCYITLSSNAQPAALLLLHIFQLAVGV